MEGRDIPSSARFITPGALEVVLRFFSSMPAIAESTLEMSDASAAMLCVVRSVSSERLKRVLNDCERGCDATPQR